MEIDNLIETAYALQEKGDFEQAESLYKEILKVQPTNVSVYYNLGTICQDKQRLDEAVFYYREALKIKPNLVDAYFNIGAILHNKGFFADAIENYQKALKFDLNSADINNNLGVSLKAMGQMNKAIWHFRKALDLDPHFDGACSNLGIALIATGQYTEGILYLQQALQINPHMNNVNNLAVAYTNWGLDYQGKGQLEEAIASYQKAIELNHNYAGAYHHLGFALQRKRQFDGAIACYEKALQLQPDQVDSYIHLGDAYRVKGLLDEAILCFQKALTLIPNSFVAYNILGLATQEQGKIEEAEKYFRHALQLNPDFSVCHSNLLFLMNYNSHYNAEVVFREHLNFAKQFEEPLASVISHHSNNKSLTRKLKIAYVSPDFRRHSVAFFIEPVLETHNRQQFEVFCYSDVFAVDETTRRIQGCTDQWRDIAGLPDEEVFSLIRQDEIDILVDLAGHTGYNRMLLFARKPAPVQLSWIGYPATTGLSAMDYKVVDTYTDPPGLTEHYYTEKLIRMPECFLCYLPPNDSPDVLGLPALTNGHITFGSFNNSKKISSGILRLWAKILKMLPNARLIIKSFSFSDKTACSYTHSLFINEDIEAERVECLPPVPSMQDHLMAYSQIDIGLDTFPYSGTTTTCEAMWMGVPVITLAGETHASRVGVSLLSNIGIPELIATTPEEYIAKAVDLAHNPEKLQLLRKCLRVMISHSPLTDIQKFTPHLEGAYRKMWVQWCKGNS